MPVLGLLLLLVGGIGLQRVFAGRVQNIPEDTSAFFSALVSADTEGIAEVMQRRGENVSADSVSESEVAGEFAESADTVTVKGATTELSKEVVRLGQNSSGYLLGGIGVGGFYDCSGIVWRAAKNIGLNPSFRFTTSNFENALVGQVSKTTTPVNGDIVLWRGHHMGVMIGPDKLYSARSPSKGIGVSSISGDSSYFHQKPEYWRVIG